MFYLLVSVMKIVRIEPLVGDAAWEALKKYVHNNAPDSDRHRAWDVIYKLKGNKHHRMTVFAREEIQAIAKAVEANQTNEAVIVLQKLARG